MQLLSMGSKVFNPPKVPICASLMYNLEHHNYRQCYWETGFTDYCAKIQLYSVILVKLDYISSLCCPSATLPQLWANYTFLMDRQFYLL